MEKDVQGRNLQHHEEYKIEVPPDEEKNITHLQKFRKLQNPVRSYRSIQDFYNFESEAPLNASQTDSDRSSSMPGRYRVQHFLKDRRPRAQAI